LVEKFLSIFTQVILVAPLLPLARPAAGGVIVAIATILASRIPSLKYACSHSSCISRQIVDMRLLCHLRAPILTDALYRKPDRAIWSKICFLPSITLSVFSLAVLASCRTRNQRETGTHGIRVSGIYIGRTFLATWPGLLDYDGPVENVWLPVVLGLVQFFVSIRKRCRTEQE